jgi:hypothetical protein
MQELLKKCLKSSCIDSTPQMDSGNVLIHDNFYRINLIFMDENIEMFDACRNLVTRLQLDTSQVGINSPFWISSPFWAHVLD